MRRDRKNIFKMIEHEEEHEHRLLELFDDPNVFTGPYKIQRKTMWIKEITFVHLIKKLLFPLISILYHGHFITQQSRCNKRPDTKIMKGI